MLRIAMISLIGIFAVTSDLSPPTQVQDIHALRVVAEAFEKAKRDNKVREDTLITTRTHRIDNLDLQGKLILPYSLEKEVVTEIAKKGNKMAERVTRTTPQGANPPDIPFDFNTVLDSFLSRFYFMTGNEKELIDGRSCLQIHFWPKDTANLPPGNSYRDEILNRMIGIVKIDEKTLTLVEIETKLKEPIDTFWYDVYIMDFTITFGDSHNLRLITAVRVTARYTYHYVVKTTRRYQKHKLDYVYRPLK